MSKWQDKTRGGWPVENVRPYDGGDYVWQGVVEFHSVDRMHFTWTKDGLNVPGKTTNFDLIPLEAPAEAPADPDARKALVMAAKAYKLACDVMDLAMEEERQSLDAFLDLRKACWLDDIVVAIGEQHFLFSTTDDEILISEIEVL